MLQVYKWSISSAISIAHKLTDKHMYADGQLKMSNVLAEEVLDRNFLNAVKVKLYCNYL